MILPTKRLPEARSLIGIGADLLVILEEPKTISRLWNQAKNRRLIQNPDEIVTYDWFVLTLDLLFAVNAITIESNLIRKAE